MKEPQLKLPMPMQTFGTLRLIRACDVVAASVLLTLSLPVLIICAVLIKLDGRGPALFQPSTMRSAFRGHILPNRYRLRTLRAYYTEKDIKRRAADCHYDIRLGPFGKAVRWSRIDELPMLINVLNGQVSLFGPILHPSGMVIAGFRDLTQVDRAPYSYIAIQEAEVEAVRFLLGERLICLFTRSDRRIDRLGDFEEMFKTFWVPRYGIPFARIIYVAQVVWSPIRALLVVAF